MIKRVGERLEWKGRKGNGLDGNWCKEVHMVSGQRLVCL